MFILFFQIYSHLIAIFHYLIFIFYYDIIIDIIFNHLHNI